MNCKIIEISSFDKLIQKLTISYTCGHYVYRGVKKSSSHKLIPTIGRLNYLSKWSTKERLDNEKEILEKFRLKALGQIENKPSTQIEWLVFAQHHGLPTRLLDWTRSPLVALFFATQPIYDPNLTDELGYISEEGVAIYVMHDANPIDIKDIENPFDVKRNAIFYPPNLSPRINNQISILSIQKDPYNEFYYKRKFGEPNNNSIDKLVIPQEVAYDCQQKLYRLGIREEMIFPGLDSTAKSVNLDFQFGHVHYTECKNDTKS